VPTGPERASLRALLGDTLRRYRERAGLSQVRLAELAGVNRHTVERLEYGERRPTPAMLAALARALAGDDREAEQLAALLATAAGASLRVDTPGGVERRIRRTEQAVRAELRRQRAAAAGATIRPARGRPTSTGTTRPPRTRAEYLAWAEQFLGEPS
jgi:transcriptional regulator with XRE-family HTH domain